MSSVSLLNGTSSHLKAETKLGNTTKRIHFVKFRKSSREAYHFNVQPVMSLNTTLVLLGALFIFGKTYVIF